MIHNLPKLIRINSRCLEPQMRFQTVIIFVVIDENIVPVGSRSQIDFKVYLHDQTTLQHDNKIALWVLHHNIPDDVNLCWREEWNNFAAMTKRNQEQTLD